MLILFATAAALIVAAGSAGLVHRMCHPTRRTYAFALSRNYPTSPADVGLDYEELRHVYADGHATTVWLARGGAPDGPAVLMTHGWSNSRFGALPRAALLAPFASRVVMYDMRGHGDSSARRTTLGAIEKREIVALAEACVPGELVLYGSSMGAGITIAAAAEPGDAGDALRARLRGVVVEGPYRHAMEPVARHLWLRGSPPEPFCWLAGLYLAARHGHVGEYLRGEPRTGRQFDERVRAGDRAGAAAFAGFDRARLAARLPCPLLVLHGTDDPICPIDSARQIAAAAERGAIVEFPGGLHGGLAGLDPDRYLESIESFFART